MNNSDMKILTIFLVIIAFTSGFNSQINFLDEPEQSTELKLPFEFNNSNLLFEAIYENDDSFQIRIIETERKRYEVPKIVVKDPVPDDVNIYDQGFILKDRSNPLDFSILSSKKNPVFTFTSQNFNYTEFYISFSYTLTSQWIFGNGERVHYFQLGKGIYTTWANDTGTPVDLGTGGFNLYGMHPFILNACSDGTWLGIFFVNSNAQDLLISDPAEDGSVQLEQRTIGGIIDLRIIRGTTPDDVIRKYHSKIGFPLLPPLWAIGWHQCRWGYHYQSVLETIVENYTLYNVPLDTIWSDIDYMKQYEDFTLATKRYPTMKTAVENWNSEGVHFVPIVDIGIKNSNDTPFKQLGVELETLVISNFTKQPYLNSVWPGQCVFPDFTHPNGYKFWSTGLETLHNLVLFDGVWQDMNEPSVFGPEQNANITDNSLNMYANLPYIPGNGRIDLVTHSVSVNAYIYGNGNKYESTIYNMKSFNTYMQNKVTNQYLQKDNKRAFILSRSSLFGEGHYANHWLGDNFSTFNSMKYSIPGIFNFQMFGFNLVGADICGFNGNTTDHLCARWVTLGSFYPFSRNHNSIYMRPQEPWALGPLTLEAARLAIRLRYSLLRYFYTNMFIHSKIGGTFFKPTFFNFPNDPQAFNYIDRQFMLGSGLLVTPALEESTDSFDAYFPNANWNAFPTGESILDYNSTEISGKVLEVSGEYGVVNMFIKGGSIIPFQDTQSVLNTKGLVQTNTSLYINPDHQGNATGKIIFDDGISVDVLETGDYIEIDLTMNTQGINLNLVNDFSEYSQQDIILDSVVLFRGNQYVNSTFSGVSKSGEKVEFQSNYDDTYDVLTLKVSQSIRLDELISISFEK